MNTTTIDVDAVETPKDEVNTKKNAADKLITNAAKWSVAAAIIPIPTVDMVALGAVQVNLVSDLAHLYGASLKMSRYEPLCLPFWVHFYLLALPQQQ